MKTVSPTLATLINSGAFFNWDLYKISCTSGLVIRLTTADFDVIDTDTNVYSCGSIGSGHPKIDAAKSRVRGHWKRGLDSDEWNVTIMPQVVDPFTGAYTYPDVAGGTPWLTACRVGLFDNAEVVVSRAYFPTPTDPEFSDDFGADFDTGPLLPSRACTGSLVIFRGFVDTIDLRESSSIFTIRDYKSLLSITLPRNVYQSACRHQLFDSGCTLAAASFARSGEPAFNGSAQNVIRAGPPAAPGSGTWQLGRIVFTSGANQGFQRTIGSWDGQYAFTLVSPFPFPITAGDQMTFYPGCDKQLSTCQSFGNRLNFGGEPWIPAPEVTLGG